MGIDVYGYIGLGFGLFAITKKNMLSFRLWHIVSSISYMIYGILLFAPPIVIAGLLFVTIHLYNLHRMTKKEKKHTKIEH